MPIQDSAHVAMESVCATKVKMCEDAGGPYDLSPMLHIEYTDGTVSIAMIPDRDYIVTGVMAVNAKPIEAIAFVADTYMRNVALGTPLPERGEIGAAFRRGEMSVQEGLVVEVVEVKSGEILTLYRPYRYDDRGQPVFEPFEEFADGEGKEAVGQVVDNLRLAAAFVR